MRYSLYNLRLLNNCESMNSYNLTHLVVANFEYLQCTYLSQIQKAHLLEGIQTVVHVVAYVVSVVGRNKAARSSPPRFVNSARLLRNFATRLKIKIKIFEDFVLPLQP